MSNLRWIAAIVAMVLANPVEAVPYSISTFNRGLNMIPTSINNDGTITAYEIFSRMGTSSIFFRDGSVLRVDGPTYLVRDSFVRIQGITDRGTAVGEATQPAITTL